MENTIPLDWGSLALLMLVTMRMSGMILFNPLFGRTGIPNTFKAGLVLVISLVVHGISGGSIPLPTSNLQFMLMLLFEMLFGALFSSVIHFFFAIPLFAGAVIDTQMGMSMGQTYDPGSQANVTVSSTMLNLMMVLLFIGANGHLTLFQIIMTSGEILPYGSYWFGENLLQACQELFVHCMILAMKLTMPILGAELLAQVGMGVLMKAIPQINVFAINIDLKILIGFGMFLILLNPISYFFLEIEVEMLHSLREILSIAGTNAR